MTSLGTDIFSLARRSMKHAELPIGRFGTVDEIAPVALLLASAAGSYFTGQTLSPDGDDVML
jgi:3-oxoacyl-[acyl-carrier protein] reductase